MFFSLMELTLETYESTSIITGPPRKHKLRIKMRYNIPSSLSFTILHAVTFWLFAGLYLLCTYVYFSMVKYSIVWYSMVWYGMVWYSVV